MADVREKQVCRQGKCDAVARQKDTGRLPNYLLSMRSGGQPRTLCAAALAELKVSAGSGLRTKQLIIYAAPFPYRTRRDSAADGLRLLSRKYYVFGLNVSQLEQYRQHEHTKSARLFSAPAASSIPRYIRAHNRVTSRRILQT